jgi:cell division protein ZapA
MAGRTVQVNVRGQSYRLVTSATDEEIRRMEAVVNDKLGQIIAPGRPVPANALLLVSMALAHELEQAKAAAEATRLNTRRSFNQVLGRVDAALEGMGKKVSAGPPKADGEAELGSDGD